jgi:hypothetical protein
MDPSQLQLLAQLLDSMDALAKKLEKSYNDNDAEMFNKLKQEILDVNVKLSNII